MCMWYAFNPLRIIASPDFVSYRSDADPYAYSLIQNCPKCYCAYGLRQQPQALLACCFFLPIAAFFWKASSGGSSIGLFLDFLPPPYLASRLSRKFSCRPFSRCWISAARPASPSSLFLPFLLFESVPNSFSLTPNFSASSIASPSSFLAFWTLLCFLASDSLVYFWCEVT